MLFLAWAVLIYAVYIRILLNVVIQSGGVLSTSVVSIVLFVCLFIFVAVQDRTLIGCQHGTSALALCN